MGDSPTFTEMFKTLRKEVKNVRVLIADSAYDSRENLNLLAEQGIKPLIKVRKNSRTIAKGSPCRRMAVIEQKDPSWNISSGYTKTFFRKEGSLRELSILLYIFNAFQSL